MKYSRNSNTSVQKCLSSLFQLPLFLTPSLYCGYLKPQVKINSYVYHTQCTLPLILFKIRPKDTSFHVSVKSLGTLSLSRMIDEFSLEPVCSTMVGNHCEIYDIYIPRKCIESTIIHKIFETNSSFHVKQHTNEKVLFVFFKRFLLILTKIFILAG